MTLIAISRVKNELDIIEAFVRHHARIFDKLIVLDDGSTDGTVDILQALQAEGLPLVLLREPSVGYEQARYSSRLMRMAADQYGADWIMPLDADEFVEVADGTTLARMLKGRSPDLLKVVWNAFVWDAEDDASGEANPVLRLRRRMAPSPEKLGKVLIPARLVSDGVAVLTQGSHELVRGDVPLPSRPLDAVCLCHFPIRTVAQYAGKIAVGYLQYSATAHWDRSIGFHYVEPFRLLTTGIDPFAKAMAAQSRRYSLDDSWTPTGEPREAPLRYLGGPLSLTPVRDTMLSNILLCTEVIARTLAEARLAAEAATPVMTRHDGMPRMPVRPVEAQGQAESLAWPPSGLAPSTSTHTFQSFWSGGALTPYELLCLRSFIDHGHAFDLYTFDLNLAVPDGVKVCDAAELLAPQDFFVYQGGFGKGSPSAFANLFRYKLLAEKGGWWVDTDVVCRAKDIPAFGEFFAREDASLINTAVMFFEKQHPLMLRCLEEATRLGTNVRWGDSGPRLFTRIIGEFGYADRAFAADACYPIHYSEAVDFLRASKCASIAARTAASPFVHLWNAMLRHAGVGTFSLPPKGSILRQWSDEHPVDGWRGEYDEETLDQAMRLQAEILAHSDDNAMLIEKYEGLYIDKVRLSAEHAADAINLRAETEALRNSTSWKLTAPVRALAHLLASYRRRAQQ